MQLQALRFCCDRPTNNKANRRGIGHHAIRPQERRPQRPLRRQQVTNTYIYHQPLHTRHHGTACSPKLKGRLNPETGQTGDPGGSSTPSSTLEAILTVASPRRPQQKSMQSDVHRGRPNAYAPGLQTPGQGCRASTGSIALLTQLVRTFPVEKRKP